MSIELNMEQTVNEMLDIGEAVERFDEVEDLSAEQQNELGELHSRFKLLEAHKDSLVAEQKRDEVVRALARVPSNVYKGDGFDSDPLGEPQGAVADRNDDPWNLDGMRSYPFDPEAQVSEFRSRALSAIEKMPGTTQARREGAAQIVEEWDTADGKLARLALATSSPAYMRAFGKYLKHGHNVASFLTEDEQKAVTRAMSLTDAEGGFLVPFQLDPSVIITSDGSLNQIRQVARQVIATGDVWNGVSSGAVTFSWDAEAAEVSDDATTFAQPSIPVYKGAGFVPISIEALQDEANVTTEIGRLLSFGKDVQDAAAFATGTGSAQPTGIVTALTGGASEVSSATTDVFAIADVYAVHNDLPARYRPNASFLANNAIYNLVRQFDTAGGAGLWTTLGNDRPQLLLGKRALESEDMDGSVTALADNYILVFGDFSNYVIADRVGMSVETIPHLFATANNLPSGQRGFYAFYRLGADSVNDGGFSMLNVT